MYVLKVHSGPTAHSLWGVSCPVIFVWLQGRHLMLWRLQAVEAEPGLEGELWPPHTPDYKEGFYVCNSRHDSSEVFWFPHFILSAPQFIYRPLVLQQWHFRRNLILYRNSSWTRLKSVNLSPWHLEDHFILAQRIIRSWSGRFLSLNRCTLSPT